MRGTYQGIESRQVNTKFGPKTAYSVTIDGKKVGLGFNNKAVATIQVGSVVEYEVEEKNGYANIKSIVASSEAPVPSPSGNPATPNPTPTQKDHGLALYNALLFVTAHYSSPLVKKSSSLADKFSQAVAYADMIVQYGLTGKVVVVEPEEAAKLAEVAEEAGNGVS